MKVTKKFGLGLAGLAIAAITLNGAAKAQDTTSDDKTFIANSSQDSLAEVNFAKLALEKSKDPNIDKFAKQMIHDHEMLITSMKPLAVKYHVKVPSGPSLADKAKYTELKMKSGTDFDRAYVEAMVKDHNDDLKKFIDEENKTSNGDVKAAVGKGKGVIREHTMMIDGIAQQGGIAVPPMPNGA